MCTEFGTKLQEAINAKKNDINSLVWRDKKGNSVRLMDLSQSELSEHYSHCKQMLYNKDVRHPGKMVIKENISNCWDSCNAELFVRYLLKECDTNIKTNKDLLDFINIQRNKANLSLDDSISSLFNGLSPEYEKITIRKLMDVCFDKLGVLNRRILTDNFIISQGLWLTNKEKKELFEAYPKSTFKDRLEFIKEQLCLDPNLKLIYNPSGFSLSEFRALVQLPLLPKISSLPTVTLQLLRDKVLLLLDNELEWHVYRWNKFMQNIERVAAYKNWKLE